MIVPNWRAILRYAWSVKLLVVAAVLSGLEVVFTFFVDNPPIQRGWFALLSGLTTIAAFAARFYAQKELHAPDSE